MATIKTKSYIYKRLMKIKEVMNMNDTIAAISTALGVGAISIVRMSGKSSLKIANKLFVGCDLTTVKSHTIHYGKIINKKEIINNIDIFDECEIKIPSTIDILLELQNMNIDIDNIEEYSKEERKYDEGINYYFKKEKKTNPKYPRKFAQIKKKPL